MKVIILCGGFSSEDEAPGSFYGPMADVKGKPVIWHIMKHFARNGFNDFVICVDHDRNPIKDFFLRYELIRRDFEIILGEPDNLQFLSEHKERGWKITFVHTEPGVMSGSMVKSAKTYVGDEDFIVTHGDRVTTLSIPEIVNHHAQKNKTGTALVVRSIGRFRSPQERETALSELIDSKGLRTEYIIGGLYVFKSGVFRNIPTQGNISIEELLEALSVKKNKLSLFVYEGYWSHIDSEREAVQLRNNVQVLGIPKQVKKRILIG